MKLTDMYVLWKDERFVDKIVHFLLHYFLFNK